MRVRDPSVFEEPPLMDDEPSDLLTLLEWKRRLSSHVEDEDIGLRSLLEHPEMLARSLRQLHAA